MEQHLSENGKEIKVIVKEIIKITASCEACRKRRKKCDGKHPCASCVDRSQDCVYTERKKRGPKEKKRKGLEEDEDMSLSLVSASSEGRIIDKIEGIKYCDFYLKFMNYLVPLSSGEKMMKPQCSSHKVQAYAALATVAQALGDFPGAQKYISQARIMASDIYDQGDIDSVSAMLIMSGYWQLILDIPRAQHFASVAFSLANMVPSNKLNSIVGSFCKSISALMNNQISEKHKARLIYGYANDVIAQNKGTALLFYFVAITLEVFGLNILLPSQLTIRFTFNLLDNVHISESDRLRIMNCVNESVVEWNIFFASRTDLDDPVFIFVSVGGPLYLGMTDWRSGHITEAVSHALNTLHGLHRLKDAGLIGLLADIPLLCMTASVATFLHEQCYDAMALQVCGYIKDVCKVMEPNYNFIVPIVDEFIRDKLGSVITTMGYSTNITPSPNSSPTELFSTSSFSSSSSSSSSSPFEPTPTTTFSYETCTSTNPQIEVNTTLDLDFTFNAEDVIYSGENDLTTFFVPDKVIAHQ